MGEDRGAVTQASATALETYGMVKSWRAAVGIVHTDQITEFLIAGVEVTMLLTNGGYPVMKLLRVAKADEVAAGSAGSRGRPWRSAPVSPLSPSATPATPGPVAHGGRGGRMRRGSMV